MIETLESFDQQLLLCINGANTPLLDLVFYNLSKVWASFPIYLFAMYLLYRKYGWRRMLVCVFVICCAIGLADLISTECFKKVICRYRPTHNLDIGDFVHVVNGYRGGMYGFVSSHAANMFAFTVGASLYLRTRLWTIVFLVWSLLVCYSRMYLGVHYPADILCGAILGSVIAYVSYVAETKISAYRT
jgi:undecaprenyl-diphosphatase